MGQLIVACIEDYYTDSTRKDMTAISDNVIVDSNIVRYLRLLRTDHGLSYLYPSGAQIVHITLIHNTITASSAKPECISAGVCYFTIPEFNIPGKIESY